MKNRIKIDVPEIKWIIHFIAAWSDERQSFKKLMAMATDRTLLRKQCEDMVKRPCGDIEKALVAASDFSQ